MQTSNILNCFLAAAELSMEDLRSAIIGSIGSVISDDAFHAACKDVVGGYKQSHQYSVSRRDCNEAWPAKHDPGSKEAILLVFLVYCISHVCHLLFLLLFVCGSN